MFRLFVDGVEFGTYKHVSVAKKNADIQLECGAYAVEIKRGQKSYTYRRYNTEWR